MPARGARNGARGGAMARALPLDVYATPEEAVVIAAVPGMHPQELEITYTQNTLMLSGAVPTAADSEQGKAATWYLHELWSGPFQHTVTLPFEVDAAKAKASFENVIVRTGHEHRDDDLDRIAALGIKTLRYPVLWERVVPTNPAHPDWTRWHGGRGGGAAAHVACLPYRYTAGKCVLDLYSSASTARSTIAVRLQPRDGHFASSTYRGPIVLDPASPEAGPITATLKSQDFVIWPILVTLLGGIVAAGLNWYGNEKRPKDALRGGLTEAAETYFQHKEVLATVPPLPYTLDVYFSKFTKDDKGKYTWHHDRESDKKGAARVRKEIGEAANQEELDATATEVSRTRGLVDSWPAAITATMDLREARASLPDAAPARSIAEATDKLLAPQTVPVDAAAAAALTQELQDQATAVRLWIVAWSMVTALEPLYGRLLIDDRIVGADRTWLIEHDPAPISTALLASAASLPDIMEFNVKTQVLEAAQVLQTLDRVYPPAPPPPPPADSYGVMSPDERAKVSASDLLGVARWPEFLPPIVPPRAADYPGGDASFGLVRGYGSIAPGGCPLRLGRLWERRLTGPGSSTRPRSSLARRWYSSQPLPYCRGSGRIGLAKRRPGTPP
ncbi:MAG: Hsp20/alpha crystallin family protein [Chloroflexota bacterium]|nr:Hsp20/alpha crystallin family protein [Chloroflexota bacterium]